MGVSCWAGVVTQQQSVWTDERSVLEHYRIINVYMHFNFYLLYFQLQIR
jgi:hypothetical protein